MRTVQCRSDGPCGCGTQCDTSSSVPISRFIAERYRVRFRTCGPCRMLSGCVHCKERNPQRCRFQSASIHDGRVHRGRPAAFLIVHPVPMLRVDGVGYPTRGFITCQLRNDNASSVFREWPLADVAGALVPPEVLSNGSILHRLVTAGREQIPVRFPRRCFDQITPSRFDRRKDSRKDKCLELRPQAVTF
jgi:hypothetical protein